jgi:DNA-directed RNA polymerase beta subunit
MLADRHDSCGHCAQRGKPGDIIRISLPYAAKLLMHEVAALCLRMKLYPRTNLFDVPVK